MAVTAGKAVQLSAQADEAAQLQSGQRWPLQEETSSWLSVGSQQCSWERPAEPYAEQWAPREAGRGHSSPRDSGPFKEAWYLEILQTGASPDRDPPCTEAVTTHRYFQTSLGFAFSPEGLQGNCRAGTEGRNRGQVYPVIGQGSSG